MAGLATAGAANAATPSCGSACIDIFSHNFGTYKNPGFLLDVYKRGQNVGQPIILFRISNADPALDFTVADQGTVADFMDGLLGVAVPRPALRLPEGVRDRVRAVRRRHRPVHGPRRDRGAGREG